jgi:hypothetical protein
VPKKARRKPPIKAESKTLPVAEQLRLDLGDKPKEGASPPRLVKRLRRTPENKSKG